MLFVREIAYTSRNALFLQQHFDSSYCFRSIKWKPQVMYFHVISYILVQIFAIFVIIFAHICYDMFLCRFLRVIRG